MNFIEEKLIAKAQVAPSNNYLMSEKFLSTQEALTLKVLYKTMPVKMQCLGLVCYEDSFTGKEAVDHLEPILPLIFVTEDYNREDCIKLLQQYVNRGYFANVQNKKNKNFQDDDTCLYKFQHEVIGNDLNEEKSRVRNFRKQLISSIYTKLVAFLELCKYEELFYTETSPFHS